MTRPGVVVRSAGAAPPRGVPTDTSVTFIVSEAQMGPTDQPKRLTSMDQFATIYGRRLPGTYGYDALDAAFHEGTSVAYFIRMTDGADAATGDASALTGGTGTATAASPGSWGDSLEVKLVAAPKAKPPKPPGDLTPEEKPQPENAVIAEVLLAGTIVQRSLALGTNEELQAFFARGEYVRLTASEPTGTPKAGTVKLAGGSDGTFPVAEGSTALDEALALLTADLGPGQVLAPGRADAETHAALLTHAAGTTEAGINRVAFLDGEPDDDAPTLESRAGVLRGAQEDRYGAIFAPWAVIPGVAPGTSRRCPWSALQAGICARNDAANPNQAAAGAWGVSTYANDLTRAFSDAERESLLNAGVNTARSVYGTIENYAFRTLVDPQGPRSVWRELNHARLNMAIVAKSEAVGEEVIFSQLDGRGITIAKFNGKLAGMLKELYDDGALYGDEPSDAYAVNTGPAVNTPEKLADGILAAVLSVRMSPHGELVEIEIVKVPITVALAA